MISVIGAGAFGTALAISQAQRGPVILWARNTDHAEEMARERQNKRRLGGIPFPDGLRVTSDKEMAAQGGTILLAIPMQTLQNALEGWADALDGKRLVACCKGVDLTTGRGPVEIVNEAVPGAVPAILTGPSFASDIARGLPTALTLACGDETVGRTLQEELTTRNIRIYRTTDTTGAELGGALKNVMAIACGVVMGARLGESARAALMTRGYAEMSRMALACGARAETLAGLSGFGDLALTCTSEQSRNLRYGMAVGRGLPFEKDVTVEGASTAQAVARKAAKLDIEMPITDVVTRLVDGDLGIEEAMDNLLSRPLRQE